jgi:two-component system nitrogen regulation response regulator GlnG
LRNAIRRAVLLADDLVEKAHLSGLQDGRTEKDARSDAEGSGLDYSYSIDADGFALKNVVKDVVERVERQVIADVLRRANGNKSKAARLLKIDYKTMHYKLKEYDLHMKD